MLNPWKPFKTAKPEDIRSLQDNKLHRFINEYLYPFSPYYRTLFDRNRIDPRSIKRVKDLKRIPFTTKLDFIDNVNLQKYRDFVLQPDKEKISKHWPVTKKAPLFLQALTKGKDHVQHAMLDEFNPTFMTFTTGTTNRPVPFLYSNYDLKNLHISGARMMSLFDIKSDQKVVNMFPYAPHLAFWQVTFGGMAACNLVLGTGGGKVLGTEGNIASILKMQPTLILGVPSYVYHVLRMAKQSGHKMPFVKKVVLGASKVEDGFKEKLCDLLESMGAKNISIFGTYGFTEARCAWAECPTPLDKSSGYFLYPDKEIFEVIDPETGEVQEDGADGELVYTSLDSRASSMLRYRTGDFVKGGIQYGKCPFTNTYIPRLSSDIVRLSNVKDLQLSKIKGALVNMNHFSTILSNIDLIEDWQLEIRKKDDDPFEVDELVVYVCAKDDSKREQIKETIRTQMVNATEVAPNMVEFLCLEDLIKRLEIETANKEKRIVDTRPKTY